MVGTVFVVFVIPTLHNLPHNSQRCPLDTGRQKDAFDATPVLSMPLNKGSTMHQGEPKSP